MCGVDACDSYSADFKEGGALIFLLCVCLEFNASACAVWHSCIFVICFMFYVVDCV